MAFDAYHKWLGIPRIEQPPHHYRLLGIAPFEDDPDVIEEAADRQMAHVQRHKTGPQWAVSQVLLTELAAAKICLLDPRKRALYNAALRGRFEINHREMAPLRLELPPRDADHPSVQRPRSTKVGRSNVSSMADDSDPIVVVRTRGGRPTRRRASGWPALALTVVLAVLIVSFLTMTKTFKTSRFRATRATASHSTEPESWVGR